MFAKNKPYRSKSFLSFCHSEMKHEPCCLCDERQWKELHHFGADGGMGMKPNDLEVARLCQDCHMDHGGKKRSLIKSMNPTDLILLVAFQDDALVLNRAWIEHMEDKDGK